MPTIKQTELLARGEPSGGTAGLTVFAGQFCMSFSRAIVQRGIADRFRTALAERLTKVRVGPASDPRSEMGPLINKANVERVTKMVEDAIAAGAKIIARGGLGDGRTSGERSVEGAPGYAGSNPYRSRYTSDTRRKK